MIRKQLYFKMVRICVLNSIVDNGNKKVIVKNDKTFVTFTEQIGKKKKYIVK